jgi:iron only hydrogenase large subunit-like protein
MPYSKYNNGIIYTLSAKCRDCYRCLRNCPVKAIDVIDGQAYVDKDRCIVCGKCIRECPQDAKTYRNDVETVVNLLRNNDKVIASIAPSFPSFYNEKQLLKIPSILRKLGFWKILNTSETVENVIEETLSYVDKNDNRYNENKNICTACPVVVNYVEKYKSDYVENMVPVISPMIAHGKLLKETFGENVKVVFIGPCIAKKMEAERDENVGIIDSVLTFKELDEWIKSESIDTLNAENSEFDKKFRYKNKGIFPLPGGTIDLSDNRKEFKKIDYLTVNGKNVIELFECDDLNFDMIELLFCEEGCIDGPGTNSEVNIFKRKYNLLKYYDNLEDDINLPKASINKLKAKFNKRNNEFDINVPKDRIREIFSLTGKENEEDRLNCGACGYNTCEEKAKAVYLKRAQAEMCMPHMRRLAEKKTDVILDTIPNGLVLLDDKLRIISMNYSFREYFLCSNETLGKDISYLFDSDGYERLVSKAIMEYNSVVKFNGIEFYQHIYTLKDQNQYVGIYSKVNKEKLNEEKLFKLKEDVIHKILELREQQIKMSHDLALKLGENSAKVEEILWGIMNAYE